MPNPLPWAKPKYKWFADGKHMAYGRVESSPQSASMFKTARSWPLLQNIGRNNRCSPLCPPCRFVAVWVCIYPVVFGDHSVQKDLARALHYSVTSSSCLCLIARNSQRPAQTLWEGHPFKGLSPILHLRFQDKTLWQCHLQNQREGNTQIRITTQWLHFLTMFS